MRGMKYQEQPYATNLEYAPLYRAMWYEAAGSAVEIITTLLQAGLDQRENESAAEFSIRADNIHRTLKAHSL